MHKPAISVVMTTYNGERFLPQQIESLLSQTLQPAEIIVCDDASSDQTHGILKKYGKTHNIIYHVNAKKLGVVENFKKAVSLASPANYIALCDQDDIWLPEKLERSYAALSAIDDGSTPAMSYSDAIVIDENKNILNSSLNNELGFDKYEHCLSTLLFGNFVLGCTIMMNREMKKLFADIPDNKVFNHDSWITLIAFTFGKVVSLQHPQLLYRKHDKNVTFANHKKSNRLERMRKHIIATFTSNNFLHDRFILLEKILFFLSEQTFCKASQGNNGFFTT